MRNKLSCRLSILQKPAYRLLLLLLLVTFACSEVIELEDNTVGGQVIIYGRISNSTEANEVIISRARQASTAPTPIEEATVKIIDDNGLEEFLVEGEPGHYVLERNIISGEPGRSYRLEVNIHGDVYFTDFQELLPVISQDEMRYEIGVERNITSTGAAVEEDVVRLFVNSDLPSDLPEKFFIRWEMEEVYSVLTGVLPAFWFPGAPNQSQCYVTYKLGAEEIFLLDGRDIRRSDLRNRELITRRIDRSFANKHYFNLIQSRVSEENFDYWERVRTLTITNGSIFDSVVGPLKGNVKSEDPGEEVFGFFEVIGIDTARLLMTNNDIPIFFEDPCNFQGDKIVPLLTVPFGCVQCLIQQKLVDPGCLSCAAVPNNGPRPGYF
ncbi:hypothetical protein BFP97_12460 [Roseivirga sp. 4D4]|uniref:DUF4249 family protein n=1 Tax=Roseivirga sp. 4D4 TaxID=1889784 RepID=UPI000853176F|nr:DUF4249 family protein [Roseivirga sp. 4D4]OEK02280.1 hypothetical protein BFP97_12460 [Roseivirga sp. 4D4]